MAEKRDLELAIEALERARQSVMARGKWRWGWKIGDTIATVQMAERERISELEPADGIDHSRLRMKEPATSTNPGFSHPQVHLDGQSVAAVRAVRVWVTSGPHWVTKRSAMMRANDLV